jgi:hypothetical protein
LNHDLLLIKYFIDYSIPGFSLTFSWIISYIPHNNPVMRHYFYSHIFPEEIWV